jgi:hypothetical protein
LRAGEAVAELLERGAGDVVGDFGVDLRVAGLPPGPGFLACGGLLVSAEQERGGADVGQGQGVVGVGVLGLDPLLVDQLPSLCGGAWAGRAP